ncbi:hypothetical protein LOTGIDRAFT_163408 [Lottia gigantea]|uniref:PDZ domain-containing protein n=1 Tax=Lottia gigantea TaxID=225164 RepID=V3ZK50_LOTGI|nr:hypothetical protein LOTGIDRAFT_163408 [Lottia gigantea]ESO91678.1 hypothetical protein LOTGIDRAFT_163408 [Lottia gigantea]
MFSFRKKDKEKDKEKKDKKEKDKKEKKEKKEAKQKERPHITPEEMSHLEELKNSVFRRFSDRDKTKSAGHHSNLQRGDGVAQSDSSESNLSASGSSGRPSPTKENPDKKPATLTKSQSLSSPKPPPILPKPKTRGILKDKSEGRPAINHSDLDDSRRLQENTRLNEEMSGIMVGQALPAGMKPKPTTRSSLQQGPTNTNMNQSNGTLEEFQDDFPLELEEKTFNKKLELPAIVPPKPPRVRDIEVKRTPEGDFGFSLRKGSIPVLNGAEERVVTFAEPSSGPRSNQTGLIPGDRLIEVNGVNVENLTREEIVILIKKAQDVLKLRVQPIPELVELSVRPSKDGGTIDVQNEVVKGGTLRRSGSIRYQKLVRQDRTELNLDVIGKF